MEFLAFSLIFITAVVSISSIMLTPVHILIELRVVYRWTVIFFLSPILIYIGSSVYFSLSPSRSSDSSSRASKGDEYSKKTVINETQAMSLLRGCCSGAGGTWTSYDDCVSPNTSAFVSCADNGNTYIRFSSGNVYKLDAYKHLR